MENALPGFNHVPRAIAVDLDGTLLNSRTELSPRNRAALEACINRGIPVIIATSRPARLFNRVFPASLAGQCSFVLMNGALASGNRPLSGYYREPLEEEALRAIVDCALGFDPRTRITIEIEGHEFGANWSAEPAVLWQRNSATPDMVLTIEEAIKRNPCKVALGGTDIFGLADALKQRCGDAIAVVGTRTGPPLLNVTGPRATKPEALRRLLAPHGIPLADVMAFGDDLPDAGMLQACGISVAMANALPEIKAISVRHTASNDDDGVAVVLEEVLDKAHA